MCSVVQLVTREGSDGPICDLEFLLALGLLLIKHITESFAISVPQSPKRKVLLLNILLLEFLSIVDALALDTEVSHQPSHIT